MTALVDEEIRGLALERFERKLKDIYFFEQRARRVSEELDDEALVAQESLNQADYELELARDSLSSASLTELQKDVDICLYQFGLVQDKPEVWRREIGRHTAINLCIA